MRPTTGTATTHREWRLTLEVDVRGVDLNLWLAHLAGTGGWGVQSKRGRKVGTAGPIEW